LSEKDKDILASVVMNCYNSDKYLREAIDSVYSQTYKNWELVFFDNASTDKSAQIANTYDNKLIYFKNERLVLFIQSEESCSELL